MSKQPAPERVVVSGPLARFADGFRVDLIERGYSPWRAQEQLYLLAHVSRWMEAERLELAGLTLATLERYFVWRRREGYRKSLSRLECPRGCGHLIAWVCPTRREGCGVHAKDASAVSRGVSS